MLPVWNILYSTKNPAYYFNDCFHNKEPLCALIGLFLFSLVFFLCIRQPLRASFKSLMLPVTERSAGRVAWRLILGVLYFPQAFQHLRGCSWLSKKWPFCLFPYQEQRLREVFGFIVPLHQKKRSLYLLLQKEVRLKASQHFLFLNNSNQEAVYALSNILHAEY